MWYTVSLLYSPPCVYVLCVSVCVGLGVQLVSMLDYLVQVSSSQGEGQAKGITAAARVAAEKVRYCWASQAWMCVVAWVTPRHSLPHSCGVGHPPCAFLFDWVFFSLSMGRSLHGTHSLLCSCVVASTMEEHVCVIACVRGWGCVCVSVCVWVVFLLLLQTLATDAALQQKLVENAIAALESSESVRVSGGKSVYALLLPVLLQMSCSGDSHVVNPASACCAGFLMVCCTPTSFNMCVRPDFVCRVTPLWMTSSAPTWPPLCTLRLLLSWCLFWS